MLFAFFVMSVLSAILNSMMFCPSISKLGTKANAVYLSNSLEGIIEEGNLWIF